MANEGNNSKTALVAALNGALADHLALYIKTKNFHWHVAGSRFRDLHLLFDEQAQQIIGLVDTIGERVRKLGAKTLTSVGSVVEHTKVTDQDNAALSADAMVSELRDDNVRLKERLIEVKTASEDAGDHATGGAIDEWIDQTEERIWFLTQTLA